MPPSGIVSHKLAALCRGKATRPRILSSALKVVLRSATPVQKSSSLARGMALIAVDKTA